MRRLLRFALLVFLGILLWNTLKDPVKRRKLVRIVEDSTGVQLQEVVEKAEEGLDNSWELFTREIEEYYQDPQFRQSLEKWGKNTFQELLPQDQERLRKDLKKEWQKHNRDFEALWKKYLENPRES